MTGLGFLILAIQAQPKGLAESVGGVCADLPKQSFLILRLCLGALGAVALGAAAVGSLSHGKEGLPTSFSGLQVGCDQRLRVVPAFSTRILLGLLGVGAALRIFSLESDLWNDEIGTVITYLLDRPTSKETNDHLSIISCRCIYFQILHK